MTKGLLTVTSLGLVAGAVVLLIDAAGYTPPVAATPVKHEAKCDLSKVPLGVSRDEVLRTCGEPERINRDRATYGMHEQWVYDGPRAYLYIENGVLTYTQY